MARNIKKQIADYDRKTKGEDPFTVLDLFHIAEEVTVSRTTDDGQHRRPDVVIYVNGIAVAVIELKGAIDILLGAGIGCLAEVQHVGTVVE